MSRLARSIANSLRLDDDESESAADNDVTPHSSPSSPPRGRIDSQETRSRSSPLLLSPEQIAELQSQGVKEDLTELKQTLTQQFWGVATFLAPPPTQAEAEKAENRLDERLSADLNRSRQLDKSVEEEEFDEPASARIRCDSPDVDRGMVKMTSNRFPFGSRENREEIEEEGEEEENEEFSAVGITDEVLTFAMNIGHHPETWLDFPLDPDEDLDDFVMTDAQREHTMIIEHLSPQLAALRIELCPCHMNESYFWKVYFVLLHSRLDKQDAEVLSTPQVMEARAMWMNELHKQTKPETDWYGRTNSYSRHNSLLPEDLPPTSSNHYAFETISPRTCVSETTSSITTEYETEKHTLENLEMRFVDKSVIEEKPSLRTEDKDSPVGRSSKLVIPNFEDDDDDDWPEDEGSEPGGCKSSAIYIGNEEDISFSDLEDDVDCSMPLKTNSSKE